MVTSKTKDPTTLTGGFNSLPSFRLPSCLNKYGRFENGINIGDCKHADEVR